MPTQNDVKSFFSGKQNRDNDPRVIPNGEFIRLVNGRIGRSEEDGVGALENTLGNVAVTSFVDAEGVVLGSVRDIAESKVYYFIHGTEEDAIYEFSEETSTFTPLIRDDRTPSLLNFDVDHLITGVNIIGELEERLLLWTDNLNPPRKINIQTAKDRFNGDLDDVDGRRITDEFISVVKTPPLQSPLVEEVRIPDAPLSASETDLNPFLEGSDLSLGIEQKREKVEELVNIIRQADNLEEKFPRFAYRWRYEDNEYSALSPFSEATFRPGPFEIDPTTGILRSMENQIKILDISFNTGPREVTEIELVYKEDGLNEIYVVESYNKEDREWGNNVDLSPDNIETGERAVRFSSQKLYRLLPSRELGRVYDAVPLRAGAQEVIDNRVVYGNYVDQYDLIDIRKEYGAGGELLEIHRDPIVVSLTARRTAAEDLGIGGGDFAEEAERNTEDNVLIPEGAGYDNLKSDRDYELGVVYLDDIGRQTPVLTSQNNTVHVPASNANTINRISVDIESKAPEFATGYRFFIKQTKGDFYNIFPISIPLADTNDLSGNYVWIRINDDDQNKIKPGDYINLKVTDPDSMIETEGRELFRVDAVEAKGINFLDNTIPEEGGEVIVRQSAGIYMRLEDTRYFFAQQTSLQETTENNVRFSGDFTSNNSSESPVVAIDAEQENAEDQVAQENLPDSYIEDVIYYPNIGRELSDEERPEAEAIDLTGSTYTITPGDGVIGDAFSGSIRFEITILPNVEADRVRLSWRYWIGTETGITISGPSDPINVAINSTDPIPLVHGFRFKLDGSRDSETADWGVLDFAPGDRYTFVGRRSANILWGRYNDEDTKKGDDNPNRSDERAGFTSRKSNAVLKLPTGVIPQGSQFQLGVEDGFGTFDGTPIALQFNNNNFQADSQYENIEEWMFEEQLYDDDTTGGLTGSGSNPGGGGTIFEQFGFWRGVVSENRVIRPFRNFGNITAADAISTALNPLGFLTGNLEVNATTTRWQIVHDTDGELGMIINSGTRNPKGDRNNHQKRMSAQFYFSPGNVLDFPFAFETQPEDGVLDLYYEIPDTFTCLNGIHFGNEMSNHQMIEYIDAEGNPTQSSMDADGNPIPLTETKTVSKITINLDYTNCYAFRNGIESASIRDEISGRSLEAGAKASTVSQRYRERRNVANLIFSQPFNAQNGVNGLNDFSSSEAALGGIIKEMDIADGSIQKLFSRDTDLTVFQEDKVNKVLVNKDQLFNADGSSNITSTQQVLGQTVPYAGEFGISKNPESFAVYGNRLYFSDKNRGAILRLSNNGLTEISNYGMRDFFRDELSTIYQVPRGSETVSKPPIVLGSYDDYHDQYVISIREPLISPRLNQETQPLLLSKQAFLSRTDACVYPENDLQFTQVYEFYTESGTVPIFNEGDIIFYDMERTSRFNGDNDWFVYFQEQRIGETIGTGENPVLLGDIIDNSGNYLLSQPLDPAPVPGQVVTVSLQETGTTLTARVGEVGNEEITLIYEGVIPDDDMVVGSEIEIDIRHKFVIQIDRFGFVLDKLDCLHIVPPNHDAVRVSLRGFISPQDACGKGIVARIVYHNGNDPTPDPGDAIFDTPFGEDEFIQGNYFKGRTQKRGWYKMFDGVDFEDYVINIIQGRVVERVRCAEIDAGRRRILTSESPLARREGESEVRLATRICAMLPTEANFHNGDNPLPVPGDTMFEDNFSNSPLRAGFYAIEGGSYVELSATGVVRTIQPCTIIICVDDVVNEALIDVQNNSENSFTFQGVGGITAELPTISSSPATEGADVDELVFNGAILDLGEFRSVTALWYYQIGGDEPSERALVRDGAQLLANDGANITNTGAVGLEADRTVDGFPALTNVYSVFAIMVDNIIVTTDVQTTRTTRSVVPVFGTFTVTDENPVTETTQTFTANTTAQVGDEHTYVLYQDDVVVMTSEAFSAGNSSTTFVFEDITSAQANGVYRVDVVFSDLILQSPELTLVERVPDNPITRSLTPTFGPGGQLTSSITPDVRDDQQGAVPFGYAWTEILTDVTIDGDAEFGDNTIPEITSFAFADTSELSGVSGTRTATVLGTEGATFTITPSIGDAFTGTIPMGATTVDVDYTIVPQTIGDPVRDITFALTPNSGTAISDVTVSGDLEATLTQGTFEVTMTVSFTDSTGTDGTLNDDSDFVMTGLPGAAVSFSRSVARINDAAGGEGPSTRINTVDITETGDTSDSLGFTQNDDGSNRTVTFSGSLPNENVNIDIDVSVTTASLMSRGCSVGGSITGTNFNLQNGSIQSFSPSWNGGDNGSFSVSGSADEFGSFSGSATPSSGASGTSVSASWSPNGGSLESLSFTVSVGENDTHRSCSVSASRTIT